jgi:hypothetical protein
MLGKCLARPVEVIRGLCDGRTSFRSNDENMARGTFAHARPQIETRDAFLYRRLQRLRQRKSPVLLLFLLTRLLSPGLTLLCCHLPQPRHSCCPGFRPRGNGGRHRSGRALAAAAGIARRAFTASCSSGGVKNEQRCPELKLAQPHKGVQC